MFWAIPSLVLVLLLMVSDAVFAESWNLPPLPPPSQYGNVMINRSAGKSDRSPVTFSHWGHRVKYTCRVCHSELGFEMKANATEITEEKMKNGQYCGACHDGRTAFGHTPENCDRCHNGNMGYGEEKFRDLESLPSSRYGSHIDWTEAISKKLIQPKQTIFGGKYAPDSFRKVLTMEPQWAEFPPAVFPHEVHNSWLDCSSCHPDIFNIKKKATKHFSMNFNNEGKFCGVCHLSVAFPLNNCKRCHPALGR
ncbi:MAG: hypothetical protein HZA17_03965 [Nitrospirae bacterium]|nr:hypothetical protein [Nitrospirota bacterium]